MPVKAWLPGTAFRPIGPIRPGPPPSHIPKAALSVAHHCAFASATLSRREKSRIAPQWTHFHGDRCGTSGAMPHIRVSGSIEVDPKIDVTTTEKHSYIGSRPPCRLGARRTVVEIQIHVPSSSGEVVDSCSCDVRSRHARTCAIKLNINHTPTAATMPARPAMSSILPNVTGQSPLGNLVDGTNGGLGRWGSSM